MNKRRRRVLQLVVLLVSIILVCFVYSLVQTLRGIPEAYAAWDTGMLLVEYLKSHQREWPRSWHELLSVTNGRLCDSIVFRGARDDQHDYATTLTNLVRVDWSFDVAKIADQNPVTRLDGTPFPTVWSGSEPNEMVRRYLKTAGPEDSPKR